MRACTLKKFVDRIAAEFELALIRSKGNDVKQEHGCAGTVAGNGTLGCRGEGRGVLGSG